MDEGKQICLLLCIHWKVTGSEEENGVKIIQVLGVEFQFLLGEYFCVCTQCGFPEAGGLPHAFYGGHGMGNRLMAVSPLRPHYQEMLFLRVFRLGSVKA